MAIIPYMQKIINSEYLLALNIIYYQEISFNHYYARFCKQSLLPFSYENYIKLLVFSYFSGTFTKNEYSYVLISTVYRQFVIIKFV